MKKQHLPSIVTLLVLTVITVFSWIALDVYRALTTKPEPVVSAPIIEPLNPELDTATLTNIGSRVYFSDTEIEDFVPTATPTPTPEATIVPEDTPTPTVEASPTPSSSPSP